MGTTMRERDYLIGGSTYFNKCFIDIGIKNPRNMRPVAQATGHVAYLLCGGDYTMPHIPATCCIVYSPRSPGVRLTLLGIWNVVRYTNDQNDRFVTVFARLYLCCSRLPNA